MNTVLNKQTQFIDLGLIDYKRAWDYQTKLFQEIIDLKIQNRDLPVHKQTPTSNYLIFCEHPHVFTLGKSGDESNLLISKDKLTDINATYVPINRGGDITYHGPGQLVVYPIFDLDNFFTDIHKFMRAMEEVVIMTLGEFNIRSGRFEKLTGVWVDENVTTKARKICAMGVKMSRWVTMHGLALNVDPNMDYFDYIVPCGIADKAVTSISKELKSEINMELVKERMKRNFQQVFDLQFAARVNT